VEFLGFVVACAVAFILFARTRHVTEKTESLAKENLALREQVRGFLLRVQGLERALENLGRAAAECPATAAEAAPEVTAERARPTDVPAAAAPAAKSEIPREAPLVETPAIPPAASEVKSSAEFGERPDAAIPSMTAAQVAGRGPTFASQIYSEAKKKDPRSLADLEERLGANWLNKIGTAAFVIGVALLLNYSMHYLGPGGKIALGYVLSAMLLGIGVYGETKERYRIVSRAVLGGGWALAYFTTYALHNIAAVRLVASAGWGFALLFAVAVAMVAHSLRYHSEITTGFAFLLAFATVAASEIPMGGLVASALLAAALVVILRARNWYAVEPLAIIATYAVHWMWLTQVYERIGGRKPFPEFAASVTLLTAYWAIYVLSYFLREAKEQREEWLLASSLLLNAAGYLVLLHYQSFHPEWRFWFLLGAGAAYFGVAAWSRHAGRRWGFVLASTLGAALMIAAIPYRYSGGRLEILWISEVEALLIAGWRLVDKHLRRLGWMGAAVLGVYVVIHDLEPRFESWGPPDAKLGWLLAAMGAAYFVNGRLKERLGEDLSPFDEFAALMATVVGTVFLLAAAWVAVPFLWTAVAWVVAGALLAEAGLRLDDAVLWYCGHGAALLAFVRLLFVNMADEGTWHNVSLRLITVSLCCAILYVASRRHLAQPVAEAAEASAGSFRNWFVQWGGISTAYTSAATLLVTLLIWDEATTAAVGLAWGLFGLALTETAEALREKPLLMQGRLVLLASFARIFIADLNSVSRVGPVAAPVITVTLVAAIYYYAAFRTQDSPAVRGTLLWFGTLSLAALLRFELPVEWVAVSWAAMAVGLYALARLLRNATFRQQCYAMTLLCGVRCAFDNFYQLSPWHFTDVRTATVAAAALLLYLLFAAAKLTRERTGAGSAAEAGEIAAKRARDETRGSLRAAWRWIGAHEQHLFFFVPTILLTVLVSLEVRRGFLTAAWGVEGLIVFLAVLKMDERAYRWFSLLLFLLCVARIVTVDVWNLDALGRIVSFLGLGAALLVVSFLYARHREVLRRVL
jgi:Predicted membrane protein (DUF2339)